MPRGSALLLRPFPRFLRPTALSEVDSDWHRACLTRLRYALRLSQPLDVLFHPRPVQPCFMLVTLLGLVSQRVPLPDSGACLTPSSCDSGFTTRASLHAVCPYLALAPKNASSAGRGSKGLRIRRVRSPQAGVTRGLRVDPLSDLPLRGLSPSTLATCFHAASSHGLRHSAERLPARRPACSTECQ